MNTKQLAPYPNDESSVKCRESVSNGGLRSPNKDVHGRRVRLSNVIWRIECWSITSASSDPNMTRATSDRFSCEHVPPLKFAAKKSGKKQTN